LAGFEGTVVRRISTQKTPSALCAVGEHKIAVGFFDGAITVWDSATNECKELLGHTASVNCLTHLSDASLVSGSRDHTACVWDPISGQARFPLMTLCGSVDSVVRLSDFSLATGSYDGQIHAWCFLTGELLFHKVAHEGPVWALTNLTDDLFASGSADRTVKVWRKTGECVSTFHQLSVVYALSVFPNGLLAVGFWLPRITVLDASTGRVVQTIETKGAVEEFAQLSNELFATQPSDNVLGLNHELSHKFALKGHRIAALPNDCLALATKTGFHVIQ